MYGTDTANQRFVRKSGVYEMEETMAAYIKRHKKLCISALAILVIIIAAALIVPHIIGKKSSDKTSQKQNTIQLKKMDLTTSVSATGTLASSDSETVSAAVNNITVKKVNVSVGDTVKKGDKLITFDESDLKNSLADAKTNLTDTKSEANRSISSARKKLSDAKKSYQEEKDSISQKINAAKKEWNAAKKQVKTLQKKAKTAKPEEQATLQEQLSKAQETLKQAKESYETAKDSRTSSLSQSMSNIDSAKEELATAQSNAKKSIREAKAQAEDAKKALEDCSVTAAMDGTVTSVSVEEGAIYTGGDIMEIENADSFVVTAYIDEYDISKIKKEQKVVILTEATGDQEIEGKITFIAPKAGSSQSQSQSQDNTGGTEMSSGSTESGYEVQIQVISQNDDLKLGMTAKCSIILEEADDVFAVPYDAIHEKSDGTKVIYVTDDGTTDGSAFRGGKDGTFGESDDSSSGSDSDSSFRGGKDGTLGESDDSSSGSDSDSSFRSGKDGTFGEPGDSSSGSDSEAAFSDRESADNSSGEKADTSGSYREITVTTGMESDYYVEISGDDLTEGLSVIIPTEETDKSSDETSDRDERFSLGGGNMPGGGNPPNGKPGGH